jgi:hypothetical protein
VTIHLPFTGLQVAEAMGLQEQRACMTGREVNIMKALFQRGAVVMTQCAKRLVEKLELDPAHYLACHVTGDWGNLDEHDKQENELSLKKGFRVLSAYGEADGKLWVITEADRSVTTILRPE